MKLGKRLLYGFDVPLWVMKPLFGNFKGKWSSYRPFLQPWHEDAQFQDVLAETVGCRLYSDETLYQVYQFAVAAAAVPGDFWECGVYRGATSVLLAHVIQRAGQDRDLLLFDTFGGIPEAGALDKYGKQSLSDTSLAEVQSRVAKYAFAQCRPGLIPDTFAGLEARQIAFALIDVDQEASSRACLEFIYPRLSPGGVIVIDDYGRPGTYGCRVAVDQFLSGRRERVLVLHTGQGVILKRAA